MLRRKHLTSFVQKKRAKSIWHKHSKGDQLLFPLPTTPRKTIIKIQKW